MPKISHAHRAMLAATLSVLAITASARAQEVGVQSPDGKIQVKVWPNQAGRLEYSIDREGKPVIQHSALGITVDMVDYGLRPTLGEATHTKTDETYPVLGVHATAVNRSNDVAIPIKSGPDGKAWTLELRVFDDGVGYRYRIPGEGSRYVYREASEWNIVPGCRMWWQRLSRGKDYEELNQQGGPGDIPEGDMIALPVTLKLPNDAGYAMLSEANVVNYSDGALQCVEQDVLAVLMHNDARGLRVEGEIVTPWRVTVVSPDLNGLVNTDILRNLCPPPAAELKDADWIKPGRALWHWRVTGRPKREEQKQWIDWTAEMGYEFYLVDDGWRDWRDGDKDAWACLKEIVDYGKSKNVAVWAWAHSRELSTPDDRLKYMDKAVAIGVVGLKLDFMPPADRHWTQWYDETLRDAAAHKLLIDYHGAVKPTGRERTWPNELTREAVRGREYGKLPGLHDVTIPFLRGVQGHADYTPTDYRKNELRGNSYAKELAGAILYTSPFLCYSGDPRDYLKSDALDVMKTIPAVWDETRVLPASEIGKTAAFARRKGDDWYVGILNGPEAREVTVDLSFLGDGTYDAVLLADQKDREDAFDRQTKSVSKSDRLDASLRGDGGYVARFSKRP